MPVWLQPTESAEYAKLQSAFFSHCLMKFAVLAISLFLFVTGVVVSQTSSNTLASQVQSVYPQVQALYIDLHEHPELSVHEVSTAAKLAGKLRQLGYDVTEHVGG